MPGKSQTSSTTKNQGGHRKNKSSKVSKKNREQVTALPHHAVGRKTKSPNLGDITRADQTV